MRIIAGAFRGKKLRPLGDAEIRPTGDRVKESLFQILSQKLVGARVLDLFCGSGALGIECLSRGAREAVFNDASPKSLAVCESNLKSVGLRAKTYRLDYAACLDRAEGEFDFIFCDPPYREDLCAEVLKAVSACKRLAPNGLVVYESEREEVGTDGWERVDIRSYGRCKVAFFRENRHE